MRMWAVCGAVVVAGVAAVVVRPPKPAAVAVAADVTESGGLHPPLAKTEPAPLPAVVEVTDLSPLLDPPAPPADPTPPRTGVVAVGFPDWQADNWHVYPDPRARFAEPIAEPYPPDDAAARVRTPEVAPAPRPAAEVAPPPRERVTGGVSPGVTYGYEQRF